MSYFIIFLTSIMVAVFGEESFVFSPNETIFSECIENYLSNSSHQYEQEGFAKGVAIIVGRRFHGKTVEKKRLNRRLITLFFELRNDMISHELDKDLLSKNLRDEVQQALEDCTFDSVHETKQSKNNDVAGYKEELIHITPNKTLLAEYIENHLLSSDYQHKQNQILREMAELTAKRFSGKTAAKKVLRHRFLTFFSELRQNKV